MMTGVLLKRWQGRHKISAEEFKKKLIHHVLIKQKLLNSWNMIIQKNK